MARVDIPIPGSDSDYESRKSRAKLLNLMVDINKDGSFKAIVKREGYEVAFNTSVGDNIVSNLHIMNNGSVLFAGATNVYEINQNGALFDRGAHGISSVSELFIINNNAVPAQYMIFKSAGLAGAVIFNGTTIVAITDTDYTSKAVTTGAHMGGRFYFDDQNTDSDFFASANLDGFTYDPLAFASADEESGNLKVIKSYKSSLWMMKSRNIEYWQTFDDSTLPVRPVQGASVKMGTFNNASADQLYDYIGFLGSDLKMHILSGPSEIAVSDIDLSLKVKQEGGGGASSGAMNPFVFFIDGPNHRYLVINSFSGIPTAVLFTWVYDLKTGFSHYRESPTTDYLDAYFSAFLNTTSEESPVYFRSISPSDEIRSLSREIFRDDGVDFDCILQTGSISFEKDSTIEYIEVEMETGVGNADSADPEMTVEYSKDGGVNFTTWGTVKLGGSTDKSNRIRMNNFGRVVRHTDFVLRLTVTEPVRVEFYGIYADVTGGF